MSEEKWTYGQSYRHRLRAQVLEHYSGDVPSCECCKEATVEFLCIDHIKGGGAKHRKEIGHGALYAWLKRENFPDGFRVLCHNCNNSLGCYGYCPHHSESRVCPPKPSEKVRQNILLAAEQILDRGEYPSIPRLCKITGHSVGPITKHRKKLLEEGLWPRPDLVEKMRLKYRPDLVR